MSVLVKPRNEPQRLADATLRGRLPISGSKFGPSSSGRALFVTPGPSSSSQQPSTNSRDVNSGSGSGDETDDLNMEGVNNDRDEVLDSPPFGAGGSRAESDDSALAPNVLAEHYLPALFAHHGPCAIRHLTQYLAVNHPTFGALPQGKQRRLVVKALELKKGISFEKVGWGRWNQIDGRTSSEEASLTPETLPSTYHRSNGSLLSASLKQSVAVMAHTRSALPGSYPARSSYSSNHDFIFSPALSVAGTRQEDDDDDVDIDPLDLDMDDENSETDEEDWKSLGAQALRTRNPSISGSYREGTSYVASCSGSLRSGPYPIRRKSSAGVYQTRSPKPQAASYTNSPISSRPTFPKTSSYLMPSPMSNLRASSFSQLRKPNTEGTRTSDQASLDSVHGDFEPRKDDRGAQAEAIDALVMLSSSSEIWKARDR